jgi:ABC-type Fe3+-hydroxamate transport system substrate-binding protein
MIILAIFTVGCNKNQEPNLPVENQIATQEPVTLTEQTGEEVSEPTGIPEDVPIMPEAKELQVTNQNNIDFKVDLPLEDVVAFYQEELINYGWDKINNPDTVVGSMAQMSRSKANGDRITFSLQYNPIGEFSIVKIFITRAP